jgi:hypothetical protein
MSDHFGSFGSIDMNEPEWDIDINRPVSTISTSDLNSLPWVMKHKDSIKPLTDLVMKVGTKDYVENRDLGLKYIINKDWFDQLSEFCQTFSTFNEYLSQLSEI